MSRLTQLPGVVVGDLLPGHDAEDPVLGLGEVGLTYRGGAVPQQAQLGDCLAP